MTTFELRTLICLNTTLDQNIVYSEINETFNCKTRNVVHCITCQQCKLQYIGPTTRSLYKRVREHIGYIRNLHTNQPTGKHFNLSHELYHLKVSVLGLGPRKFT